MTAIKLQAILSCLHPLSTAIFIILSAQFTLNCRCPSVSIKYILEKFKRYKVATSTIQSPEYPRPYVPNTQVQQKTLKLQPYIGTSCCIFVYLSVCLLVHPYWQLIFYYARSTVHDSRLHGVVDHCFDWFLKYCQKLILICLLTVQRALQLSSSSQVCLTSTVAPSLSHRMP